MNFRLKLALALGLLAGAGVLAVRADIPYTIVPAGACLYFATPPTITDTSGGTPYPLQCNSTGQLITSGSGGGGGGGAVTAIAGAFVDGWNATLGLKTDARATATDTTSVSGMSVFKEISFALQTLVGNQLAVSTVPPGTSATQAIVAACRYDVTLPVFADTNTGAVRCGKSGKQIVQPYEDPDSNLNGTITTAMTGTTSTAVANMAAQGAGVRVYVTMCVVSNAHATVGTDIVLQDGSGGTTLATLPASINYGGAVVPFPNPIRTTANTGLFAANVTTGASTKVTCVGYKGA